MELLFEKVYGIFCLEYLFSVLLASYLSIKFVDVLNGGRVVPTWIKRTITFVAGAGLFVVFKLYTDTTVQSLIATYFAAIFVYDTAIKYILKKLDVDYNK